MRRTFQSLGQTIYAAPGPVAPEKDFTGGGGTFGGGGAGERF